MAMTESQVKQAMAEPAPPRLRHRILQAGGWAGAGFVLDKVIAAIQLMVVARLLTPADFGVMAASATIVLAFMTISELGLESALIAKAEVDREDLAVAWTVSIARGVAMAVCLWAAADLIGQAMQMPQLASLLRVHAWLLVLQGLRSPAMAILLKNLDLRRRVSIDLVRRVIEAGAIIALALWLRTVWALLLGQLIGMCVGSLLSFWVAPFRPRLSLYRPARNYFLRYGKHLNLTTLCIFGVMGGGELVIGRILGQDALGLYQIALAIPIMIGMRAMSVITQISLPTYAFLQQDRPGVIRALTVQMSLTGMLVIPSALGTMLLAPHIVTLLFGPSWTGAVEPLRILCLFAMCAAFCSVMAALHCGADHPHLQTKIWALMCGAYVATAIPFTMAWGLSGAAWALGLTFLVGLALHVKATVDLLGSAAWPAFTPLKWAGFLVGVVAIGFGISNVVPSTFMGQWLVEISGVVGAAFYGRHLWVREYPWLRELWGP